jgi:hypothetical protein
MQLATIVGLNLIFIITFNFFETQIYLFFRQIKTSTLRLRKLRNNLSIIMFRHQGKKQNFIHNLRLATLLSFVAGIVNIGFWL